MSERFIGDESGSAVDALLADYAAGHLSGPLHGLVAAHLMMKPDNRSYVAAVEALRAREVFDNAGVPVSNRDAMLDRIFAHAPREDAVIRDPVIPAPIARLVGRRLSDVKWRKRFPGFREYRLADDSQGEVSLYWINAGHKIPSHTHEGTEVTLVLKGGFSDSFGHYGRGDIAIADGEVDHRPVADEGEDCICFAVTDAPLRLTGPIGRIVQRFLGH